MQNLYFSCVCFFSVLVILYAAEPAKSGCLQKEKALALLETAENFLSKARVSYPSCKANLNSTGQKECDNEKSLAYIEISKKLISDVRENFPSCHKPVIDDDQEDDQDDVRQAKVNDCSGILAKKSNKSGIYTIWPREFPTEKSLKVYCDMATGGGGWTVIQRRGKFPIQQDFNLDWDSYKNGFGNLSQEFWLGNENIRILCLKGCKIRFDLQDHKGVKYFAVYQNFNLASNYSINISDYSGNTTNSMQRHNHYDFSTKDRDVRRKAEEYKSGWWHGPNYYCNLNGIYQPGAHGTQYVYWWKEQNDYYNLLAVEIKVKPN